MPLTLIMKPGLLPDALEPDIHCVRTHWNRGFMAFELDRRTGLVCGCEADGGDMSAGDPGGGA